MENEDTDGERDEKKFFSDSFRFFGVSIKVPGDEGGGGHEEWIHEIGERPKDVQCYLVRGHNGVT